MQKGGRRGEEGRREREMRGGASEGGKEKDGWMDERREREKERVEGERRRKEEGKWMGGGKIGRPGR